MDAVAALERLGGVGTHADVIALSSRGSLRAALRHKRVLRRSRDRYVLPAAGNAARAAARVHGIVSHLGAATHWGWEVALQPEEPHVTVRHNRKLAPERRAGVVVHWRGWTPEEVEGIVTRPLRTVLDCARDLPFTEALAVADSALRHGDVDREELVAVAEDLAGPGSARARRVARHADGRAANPFESVLRGIAIEEGFDVTAQLEVVLRNHVVHPDVADIRRRVAMEGDSWEHHARLREDFERDCARYNALVVAGWKVLRFTWQQVMRSPSYVRWVLRELDGPPGRAQRPDTRGLAA